MLNHIRLSNLYNFAVPWIMYSLVRVNQRGFQGPELALVDVAELSNWRQVQYRCLYSEPSYLVNTLSQDFERQRSSFVCHMAVLWHLVAHQSPDRTRGCGSLQSVLALEAYHDTTQKSAT